MQAAEWVGFIGASFCTLCLEVWRGRERERVESLLILKAKRDMKFELNGIATSWSTIVCQS